MPELPHNDPQKALRLKLALRTVDWYCKGTATLLFLPIEKKDLPMHFQQRSYKQKQKNQQKP
jgi:hypothetical protein